MKVPTQHGCDLCKCVPVKKMPCDCVLEFKSDDYCSVGELQIGLILLPFRGTSSTFLLLYILDPMTSSTTSHPVPPYPPRTRQTPIQLTQAECHCSSRPMLLLSDSRCQMVAAKDHQGSLRMVRAPSSLAAPGGLATWSSADQSDGTPNCARSSLSAFKLPFCPFPLHQHFTLLFFYVVQLCTTIFLVVRRRESHCIVHHRC